MINNDLSLSLMVAMADKAIIFHAQNLTKTYQVGEVNIHALSGCDIDLFAKEFVVIVGPSGSGKSTFLNILGGLDTPSSGEVAFLDHDLTGSTARQLTQYRRDHVGFVFQSYNLIPNLTARENVELVTDIAEKAMKAEQALALVNLESRMNHFPSQLSGGEQQRVAIARAIAKQPDVLLCDEPTGALDCETGKLVLEAIATVNQELGTLTVIITHNIVINQMADRVFHMTDGKISDVVVNKEKLSAQDLQW